MNSEKNCSDLVIRYQNLLKMMNRTAKYSEEVNADPALVKSYRRLLRYLRSRPPESLHEILGDTTGKSEKAGGKAEPQLSDQEIYEMTFEQILDLGMNQETPRKWLERIATVRFGVTRGGLSALRTREALVAKIRTLIDNESAHDSIRRVSDGSTRKGSARLTRSGPASAPT